MSLVKEREWSRGRGGGVVFCAENMTASGSLSSLGLMMVLPSYKVGGDLRQDLSFSKLSSFSPGKGDHVSIYLLRIKEQAMT